MFNLNAWELFTPHLKPLLPPPHIGGEDNINQNFKRTIRTNPLSLELKEEGVPNVTYIYSRSFDAWEQHSSVGLCCYPLRLLRMAVIAREYEWNPHSNRSENHHHPLPPLVLSANSDGIQQQQQAAQGEEDRAHHFNVGKSLPAFSQSR